MTKIAIIKLLRAADVATIAFGGLMDPEAVRAARDSIIKDWNARVKQYNKDHPDADIIVVIGDTTISAGSKFKFLPTFPKTGPVRVRSKDFVIGNVHCDYVDILPQTFAETDATWAFQTKAGNTIIISK